MISWDADTTRPITLGLVKSFLGLLEDDYDDLLTDIHIPAAVQWAEGVMRRSILAKTHRWTMTQFPYWQPFSFQLPRGKTQSITSIKYTAANATVTWTGPSSTVPGTNYREDLGGDAGANVFPAFAGYWPTVDYYAPQPVLVTFVAGWLPAQVPAQIKHAIARYCGDALAVVGATDITQSSDLEAKDALLMPWRLECA